MTLILVAGNTPSSGATTVAVGLAHRLAYAGHNVTIERLDGDARAGRLKPLSSSARWSRSAGRRS